MVSECLQRYEGTRLNARIKYKRITLNICATSLQFINERARYFLFIIDNSLRVRKSVEIQLLLHEARKRHDIAANGLTMPLSVNLFD